MSLLAILQYPDPLLKRIAIPVDPAYIQSADIQQVIDDMFETHYQADNCAALAATQLDLKTAWHITVIDFSENKNEPLCLINAKIIEMHGEHIEAEGCMSVYPDIVREKVKRAQKITVQFLDREGQAQELLAEGFMAKCIQHELDHLAGRLYLDRLSDLKRQRLLDKVRKIKSDKE